MVIFLAKNIVPDFIASEYTEISSLHVSENINNYWCLLQVFEIIPMIEPATEDRRLPSAHPETVLSVGELMRT